MSRYCIQSIASGSRRDGGLPAPGHPTELGIFRFNDAYAVRIQYSGNGRLRAMRLDPTPAFPSPFHRFWYCLKNWLGLEGGKAWLLSRRDADDVLRQWKAEGVAYKRLGHENWVSVMEWVSGFLDKEDRWALRLTGRAGRAAVRDTEDLDRLWRHARSVATREGIEQFCAELRSAVSLRGSNRGHRWRLSSEQLTELAIAVVRQMDSMLQAFWAEGAKGLIDLGEKVLRVREDMTPLVQIFAALRGYMGPYRNALTRPLLDSLRSSPHRASRLLSWDYKRRGTGLEDAHFSCRDDNPMQLLGACPGVLLKRAPANVVHGLLYDRRAGSPAPARLWDDLYEEAKASVATGHDEAMLLLAGLVACLRSGPSEGAGAWYQKLDAWGVERWHAVRQYLETLSNGDAKYLVARELTRAINGFPDGGETEAEGLLRWLDAAGGALPLQHYVDILAHLLPTLPVSRRADVWDAAWGRVEKLRWTSVAETLCRALLHVPTRAGWRRVVDYCQRTDRADLPGLEGHERAMTLLALAKVIADGRGDLMPDWTDAEQAVDGAALSLAKQGGPARLLLQCIRYPRIDRAIREILGPSPKPVDLLGCLEGETLAYGNGHFLGPTRVQGLFVIRSEVCRCVSLAFAWRKPDAAEHGNRLLAAFLWHVCRSLAEVPNDAFPLVEEVLPLARMAHGPGLPSMLGMLVQLTNIVELMEFHVVRHAAHPLQRDVSMLVRDVWEIVHNHPPATRAAVVERLLGTQRLSPPGLQPHTVRAARSVIPRDRRYAGKLIASLGRWRRSD